MTEQTVLAGIQFWNNSAPWTDAPSSGPERPIALFASEQAIIMSDISYLYEHSATARDLLERGTSNGNVIRIGGTLEGQVDGVNYGGTHSDIGSSQANSYILLDLDQLDEIKGVTAGGLFVSMPREIAIIHEIKHDVDLTLDLVDENGARIYGATDAQQNYPTFDYQGATVVFERDVAREMGEIDSDRISYSAAMDSSDPRYFQLPITSMTGGVPIQIARLGTTQNDDNMDISFRMDGKAMLALGFNGQDTIKGNIGSDSLYGGADNDFLTGGQGADLLHGGDARGSTAGTKSIIKADGTDTADYAALTAVDSSHGIKILLQSIAVDTTYAALGDFKYASFVTDLGRDHATDTLISIEKITGTSADDILAITTLDPKRIAGSDGTAGVHQIDLGGQSKGDLIDLSSANDSYTVHLDGATPNLSDGTTTLYVNGAEQVLCNSFDSTIYGGDADEKLAGGTGFDNLHGGGGADYLFTGLTPEGGFDRLFGDAGNDNLVVQGRTSATLSGGAGNDTFWIPSVPVVHYDPTVEIVDPDAGDKLIWNGYALKGGAAYHIDYELQGQLIHWAYLGPHGVIYENYTDDQTDLTIQLPGSQTISVSNWHQGDLGITLTGGPLQKGYADPAAASPASAGAGEVDGGIGLTHTLYDPYPGLPFSNICNDGYFDNVDELSGVSSALKHPGTLVAPAPPTTAGPTAIGVHLDAAGSMADHLADAVWRGWPTHHMNLV